MAITKLVACLAILCAMIGCTIGAFMLGWGLRPASWGWIVFFAGAHILLAAVSHHVIKELG